MASIEGLTGRVILQGSPGYDEARQNYNGRFNKFPKVIVYCEVTQDVVNAILWARKQQLPFRVRSGGHSYEAFSLVDGGLVIDVSGLQKLQINKEGGTAQIGAGFRLLPLYEALWKERVTIPSGTCPTIGVSGITLGGGYGLLSRLFGMTCDNVLEVEMVTPQGKIIRANDSQHSNLFWACRGGGDGSFGVITSFTFRVHPIENVTRYRISWDFDDLEKVVRYWQTWAPHTDARLTSLLLVPAQNQGDLRSSGVFVGSEQELRQIMRPLQEATKPKTAEFHYTTWIEAARLFAGRLVKQDKFKHSSAYAYEPLSDAALGVLIHNLQTAPGTANVIAFDSYGGSISQVPTNATAFVHRKALFVIQYQSYWVQDAEADKNIQWIEQFRKSMLPYTRGAFRDYCDSMIPDWATAYFGENLARLKKVKQMYDPENLFRFEQSIPK
ncbi:FAD-binding oxidoreductase [Peribacillus sp. NPDC094092]|uniref:FAD-binding oxidoreductase n=1 Tax=Peribacillus sp. NPDC094092 TaxID=3390611 RepID=UPI003CFFCF3C